MGMVAQQTEARIQRLLDTIEVTLRSSRGWGQNGDLDHSQLLRFNDLFFPIIANHGEISSVNFADEDGREFLLLHTPEDKWINRLSYPDQWGNKTYWITWNAERKMEKVEMRELDYDTRKRPWFKGAMALPSDESVFWTDPYIFFTTKEPGITASMRWTGHDGKRYVIGHDVRLLDLSHFTTNLQLGQRGLASLMRSDGTLLAVPKHPGLASDEQLKAAVLKTPQANGMIAVASGYAKWNANGQVENVVTLFTHDNENWLSLFRSLNVGQNKVWLAVFAPESEFLPASARDLALLLLIAAAALAAGMLVARQVARRFAAPLQWLALESERIGRMELHAPVALDPASASWHEIDQLAKAQDVMRQQLLASRQTLEEANEHLEAKVEERTHKLAHHVALVEALLDTIPNPIFYKGADTRFIGCNRAYEAAFGVDRSAFIGKRVLDLEYLPETARAAYQSEDESAIRDCRRISRNDDIVFADGKIHHVLYSVTGFRNADGSPGGLIGVIVDVTSLKEAEAAAQEARRLAEAAAETKATFLATMSHEIRTPMNAIIGMTQLTLQTDLDAKQRNFLNKVDAAANGLLGLINDILDFSKIEADMMVCERVEFRLETVIGQVADIAIVKARSKDLELLFDIDKSVPDRLLGDPLRLGQVLTNLIGNAVKFTDHGEITVKACRIGDDAENVWLRFEVSDSGIGMSETQAQEIFNPFSQADSSTTRHYGGTGLGLSISKRIVELMGGQIGVVSQPGQGSLFHFTACFGAVTTPEQTPTAPASIDIRGMSVLVVDDNGAAREVFRHMLTALAFEVTTVASGAEAIEEIQQAERQGTPFGIALIDWKMPEMDGVETIRRIRADMGERAPICLLATAHDHDSLRLALQDIPVEGILDKPVTSSSLHDAIITACGQQPAPLRIPAFAPLPIEAIRHSLQGKRVLLVEDNETNQELALALLADAGIAGDVAYHGAEALFLLDRENYALVLMDCHMPVMDGFETTRRMRSDPRFADLPIVAMTANVLPGEREKCLEAGMNDYLSKPIDLPLFYRTLVRWIAPGDLQALALPVSSHPDNSTAPDAPPLRLDRADGLQRAGGNEALYQRLLASFREREADAAQRARASLQAGDRAEARRIAHSLKGLSGSIGAQALALASLRLEKTLDAADASPEPALQEWEEELAKVVSLLPAPVDSQADTATPFNPAEAAQRIRSLAELIANNDASANPEALALAQFFAGSQHAKQASNVARHAGQYDYDAAQACLDTLAAAISPPGDHTTTPASTTS